MPSLVDKKIIPRELKRNVKYSLEELEEVKRLYFVEKMTQRGISRKTGISRRYVSFLIFPEKFERAREQLRERQKDGRYNKNHTKEIRKTREYKRKIIDKLLPR